MAGKSRNERSLLRWENDQTKWGIFQHATEMMALLLVETSQIYSLIF